MIAKEPIESFSIASRLPGWSRIWAIERRAQSFGDPIERLRYLRCANSTGQRSSRRNWIACLALTMAVVSMRSDAINREPATRAIRVETAAQPVLETRNIWPVEQTGDHDLYSNGLRIENALQISNSPRSYHAIAQGSGTLGPARTQPAGIVFHTTESHQTPFEPEQTSALKRIGQELLLYVRNQRAYHFVIDRFGRVHRIVVESDAANHAGPSVWADSKWIYLHLNESFLGVAFEGSTYSDEAAMTEAQLRAGKALVEMLRAKYNLPAENCVVHAQISVNPGNWRIGFHTDWGIGFPFREMGLPDNYSIPLPSIYAFGFGYDDSFLRATGFSWKGLELAANQVQRQAALEGLEVARYRAILRHRYKDIAADLKQQGAQEASASTSGAAKAPPGSVVRHSNKTSQGVI